MQTMSGKPDFLFIGTAKAGTTSIGEYLLQHPKVRIPMKETFFFMRDVYERNHLDYPAQRDPREYVLETESYEALYPDARDIIYGEVGTGYLYHHSVAIPRIMETFGPDIPILVILRNPVDRCYSSYRHFTKDMHETLDFRSALEKEDERISSGWDFMWHHRAMGYYAEQIEPFLKTFNRVKILLYDDLKEDPEGLMREVFEFIGVPSLDELDLSKRHNPSGAPKSERLQRMITQEGTFKRLWRPLFRAVFGPETRSRIRKGVKNRNLSRGDSIPMDVEKELSLHYRDSILRLEKLIDRDLSAWRSVTE